MSKKEYFNAYYYRFESTGIDEIDNVLKEVARAGKMYHNTDMWNDEGDDGLSCSDRIQNIANESAKSIKSKQAEIERLRGVLHYIYGFSIDIKDMRALARKALLHPQGGDDGK